MTTTYVFEELDEATHEYLIAVRDCEGKRSPGIFAATSDSLPGCGCVAGSIIVFGTLLLTLIPSIGIIIGDPVGVALLQTAGFLVGGWLMVAIFRRRMTRKFAGQWVYLDPLHLYQAYREQVTITPIDEALEATVTANYNNGSYQNSVVTILLPGRSQVSFTIANETRGEQMRDYVNYLAWARGGEGGERADLDPATLGGLARYVAKTGDEPLDADRNINLNRIELDITEVPEQPNRVGRAMPSILPYIFLILYAAGSFLVMAFVINPPIRDEAIYERCTQQPLEPRILRGYLTDQRLTLHRDDVLKKLATFYDVPIKHVKESAQNPELRDGMVKLLESLRAADQPVTSVEVVESGLPDDGKTLRQDWVRDEFAKGINEVFGKLQPPVTAPPDMQFVEPPPPIGHQLIAFVKKDDDMPEAHFEIQYTFIPTAGGKYQIQAKVIIRTEIGKPPVASDTIEVDGEFSAASAEPGGAALVKLKEALVDAVVGRLPEAGKK